MNVEKYKNDFEIDIEDVAAEGVNKIFKFYTNNLQEGVYFDYNYFIGYTYVYFIDILERKIVGIKIKDEEFKYPIDTVMNNINMKLEANKFKSIDIKGCEDIVYRLFFESDLNEYLDIDYTKKTIQTVDFDVLIDGCEVYEFEDHGDVTVVIVDENGNSIRISGEYDSDVLDFKKLLSCYGETKNENLENIKNILKQKEALFMIRQ